MRQGRHSNFVAIPTYLCLPYTATVGGDGLNIVLRVTAFRDILFKRVPNAGHKTQTLPTLPAFAPFVFSSRFTISLSLYLVVPLHKAFRISNMARSW